MRHSLLALGVAVMSQPAFGDPLFKPVAAPPHVYSGGWEHFVGGGLAVFDCNGDHLPEIYAAGGVQAASLMRNTSTRGGEVSFVKDTPDTLELDHVIGAYPLDIDSDGHIDLAILRVGSNLLLRGGKDCSFTLFDQIGFTSPDKWTTAFSAMWENGRELPSLAFGNYVDRTDTNGPFRACDTNNLYRARNGSYHPPLPLSPGFCALSMLFSDWARQGRPDLRISNDRHYYVDDGQEQLWAMKDIPRLYTQADGWQKFSLWGMGIASRDITGDGYPEVFLSSMGDQRLQTRTPGKFGPHYSDVSFELGTTAHRPFTGDDGRPSTGWHISFGDVQNDGRDDVFIAKGNVEQMPDSAMKDPNNLLIQTADGRFDEFADRAGIATFARSRGAALADFNLDGLLDLAVVNRRAPLEIYRNMTGTSGRWISILLAQPAPNINAVGAWIEVDDGQRIQTREITVGGGHAGGYSGAAHFGVGGADTIRLRIIWPGGKTSEWLEVGTGHPVRVSQMGDGLAVAPY